MHASKNSAERRIAFTRTWTSTDVRSRRSAIVVSRPSPYGRFPRSTFTAAWSARAYSTTDAPIRTAAVCLSYASRHLRHGRFDRSAAKNNFASALPSCLSATSANVCISAHTVGPHVSGEIPT